MELFVIIGIIAAIIFGIISLSNKSKANAVDIKEKQLEIEKKELELEKLRREVESKKEDN